MKIRDEFPILYKPVALNFQYWMVTENSEIASFARKWDWEGYFGNRSCMVRSPNIVEFKRFALLSGRFGS